MAIEALCPTCGAVFNLNDDYEGKKVRCKKCEQIFTVGGEKAAARDDDKGVKSQVATAPAKKRAKDDDDDDDERSTKSKRAAAKRSRDDDDDDDDKKSRRKRKRTYHDDDDDDDDDRPRKRASRSSGGGGAGKVVAIVGGAVALVVLICGGAGYGLYRLVENAAEEAEAQDQQFQNAFNNPGGPFGGGFPGFDKQPKDMAEALTFLKSKDPNESRGAANWLANQALDPAKQKEVATGLETLVRDTDDNNCAAGARAMKVWGTKDNGPALAQALKQRPDGGIPGEAHKQLMAALAQVKYEAGADEIVRFLPNFFVGADAEKALADFGPGAEKAVLKCYHHPDGGVHDRARSLCMRYGTKAPALLDQTASDLGSADRGRSAAALEWLSTTKSNEALQVAKAEPARRTAIAVALNRVIDDPPNPFAGDQIIAAANRWATKDNVAALVRKLETDPWKKKEYANVLIAIGPACEAEVKHLLNHRDAGVASEAKRILNAVGSADSKSEALIADLKSENAGRIREAANSLQRIPVDEKQRAAVVSALVETLSNTGPGRTDGDCALEVSRALVIWATKDDAVAIADKVKIMNNFFAGQSRRNLIDWMGKQKAEKAIPFLTASLTDRDLYQFASKALQAMGPDLGPKIEEAIGTVAAQLTDRNHLMECYKVLGAVGTAKSVTALKRDQVAWTQKKDFLLAKAAQDAAEAITARGK
jgi:predicted Zn finger-like uncharacterized protein